MKKKIVSLLTSITLLLTMLGGVSVVQAADSDNYMEIKEFKQTNTAPTKADHVFAGWYQEDTFVNPIGKDVTEGKYYAKFVSKEVLTVGCQLMENTTTESTSTVLRLLTTVDTLKFSSVSFEFSGAGKNQELIATTAYSTIYGYTDSKGIKYEPSEHFGKESEYFIACKITGIPKAVFGETLTVTPKWTTKDGTVVRGTTRTFTIYDLAEPVKVDVYGSNRYEGADNTPWFKVSSNDPFDYDAGWSCRYIASSGGVYVGEEKRTDAQLLKLYEDEYMIRFEEGAPVKTDGLIITIDGVFVDMYGTQKSKVKFGPVSFICDGTKWSMYKEEVSVSNVVEPGANFRFQVTPSASFTYNTEDGWVKRYALSGGVYVNDSETPCGIAINQISTTDYMIYWADASISINEGTKMRIDGVFGDMTHAVKLTSKTYEYDGTEWIEYSEDMYHEEVSVSTVVEKGANFRFQVTPSASFTYNTEDGWVTRSVLYGGVYLNDSETPCGIAVKQISTTDYMIYWADASITIEKGTKMRIDGVFGDIAHAVKITSKIYEYNGTEWMTYDEEVSVATVVEPGTNFRFQVTPNASYAYNTEDGWVTRSVLYGGVYLNDSETPCGIAVKQISTTDYMIYWSDAQISITEGTKMRINGVFGDTTYAAKITSQTYVYNGTDWVIQ